MKQGLFILFALLYFVSTAQNNKPMQAEKVTIEIWSDIVCPFCYIGKKKLELAIAKLDAANQVEIVWRSFQLDPDFPMGIAIPSAEYLVQRKGYPQQQVNMMTAQLTAQGKQYDIDFQFDKARSFNTLDAHRLIQWAKTEGKSNELKQALMLHYFTKGIDLSIKANLLSVVKEVGLPIEKAKQLLESDAYKAAVIADISKASQLGIRGVPYFIIDEKETISGAQNDKVFENTLAAALKQVKSSAKSDQAGICIPDEECK